MKGSPVWSANRELRREWPHAPCSRRTNPCSTTRIAEHSINAQSIDPISLRSLGDWQWFESRTRS